MKKSKSILTLLTFISILGTINPLAFALTNDKYNPSLKNLFDSVVRIDVWEASYSSGRKHTKKGQGSGAIISNEGHILTNAHVAGMYTEKLRVTLANLENVEAHMIGWDYWTDLALIQLDQDKLKEKGLTFTHAQFGNSSNLYLGEPVLAVGTPYGLTRSVTRGVISNNNRYMKPSVSDEGFEKGLFYNWIQTDAAINPGNSGGPLVTLNGQIIGINTLMAEGAQSLGFAIPSQAAIAVIKELMAHHTVIRSYIGIQPIALQDMESFYEMSDDNGLLIQNVDPGSPAQLGGIKPGDIITTINQKAIDARFPEQIPPIMNEIASFPLGTEIAFTLKRGSQIKELKVTTEKLESRVGEKYAFENWGLSVEKLTIPIAREKKLKNSNGFIVIGVMSSFPADTAGIKDGDILLSADRQVLTDLKAFQEVYEKYLKTQKPVLLEFSRDYNLNYVVLKP